MSSVDDESGESPAVSDLTSSSQLAIRSRAMASSYNPLTASDERSRGRNSLSRTAGAPPAPNRRSPNGSSGNLESHMREESTSSDFRSVIDDLTIKNQKLKRKLNKLRAKRQPENSLFDLKINHLSADKSAQLVAMLRTFVESIEDDSPDLVSKTDSASPEPKVDSAYASLSSGDAMTDTSSSQTGKNHASKSKQERQDGQDIKAQLSPKTRHRLDSLDVTKMQTVVQRLEQVFMTTQRNPSGETHSAAGKAAEHKKVAANVEYLHQKSHAAEEDQLLCNDGYEWIYLNLLTNAAKLHEINVTPALVKRAISSMSKNLQLSPGGRRVRWRGTEGVPEIEGEYFPRNTEDYPVNSTSSTSHSSTRQGRPRSRWSALAPLQDTNNSNQSSSASHYRPVFLPQTEGSSSSSPDSRGSILSSSDGDDRSTSAPISFFKGSFYSDLTAMDPVQALHEPTTGHEHILGDRPPLRRPSSEALRWRRLSPTSRYVFDEAHSSDSEDKLVPFIVEEPPSPPGRETVLHCFDPSGLARVEDHFTITVAVENRPSTKAQSRQTKPSHRIKTSLSNTLRDVESQKQQVPVIDNGKIVHVTYSKHKPSEMPLTFYHQNSTSSDDVSQESH